MSSRPELGKVIESWRTRLQQALELSDMLTVARVVGEMEEVVKVLKTLSEHWKREEVET